MSITADSIGKLNPSKFKTTIPHDLITPITEWAAEPLFLTATKDFDFRSQQDLGIQNLWNSIQPQLENHQIISRYIPRFSVQAHPITKADLKFKNLFTRMTQTLGRCPDSLKGVSRFSLKCYETLAKEIADQQLERAWSRIKIEIEDAAPLDLPFSNASADTIRMWLEDPKNRPALQKIYKLELNELRLLTVPEEIKLFTGLSYLNLEKNNIKHLAPSPFQTLEKLENLALSDNAIETIDPKLFENMRKLRILHLDKNSIETLDPHLFQNNRLTVLYLSFNAIQAIDVDLFQNQRILSQIYLDHNKIKKIDNLLFRDLEFLTELDLSYNFIDELTSDLFRPLVNLNYLNLSYNLIRNLPPTIFIENQELQELRLDKNLIHSFPPSIFQNQEPIRINF